MTDVLFRNTAAQSFALISGYALSFLLAPIMLANLGLAAFGVWAVTGAFAVYAGLMDLGISRALARFVALYHARGERRSIEELLGLGLLSSAVVAGLTATVATLAAPALARALDVLDAADMRTVLLASAGIFSLQTLRYVCNAIPEGMQRFVAPNVATVAGNVVNFAASVAALVFTQDLVVYALANVAAEVVSLGLALVALHRVCPWVRARVPGRGLVREVLGYSLKSQLSWLAELLNGQAAKIAIGLFVDVRAAAAFEIANRVAIALKSVAVLSVSAMVPTATALIERRGEGGIAAFYRRYTPRALSVSLPLMALACAGAPVFLAAWLGEVPPDAVAVFVVLTLANALNLTTGVAYVLSLAEGRVGLIAKVSGLTAALTVGALLVLVPPFELWGAVGASILGIGAGSIVYLVAFHRAHALRAVDYVKSTVPALAPCLPAAAPVAAWILIFGVPDGGRIPSLALSLAFVAVFVAIYWPLAARRDLLPEALRPAVLRARLGRSAATV
jgi:O-antigen/teichoic acid export membrane protein